MRFRALRELVNFEKISSQHRCTSVFCFHLLDLFLRLFSSYFLYHSTAASGSQEEGEAAYTKVTSFTCIYDFLQTCGTALYASQTQGVKSKGKIFFPATEIWTLIGFEKYSNELNVGRNERVTNPFFFMCRLEHDLTWKLFRLHNLNTSRTIV